MVVGFWVSMWVWWFSEVWVVASGIWWFSSFELSGLVALRFDDFAEVWENEGFEIYDFVFELNFLGFLCDCFSRKFLGSLVCLRGRTWSSCSGDRRNEFSYGKKIIIIIIRLMFIFNFCLNFLGLLRRSGRQEAQVDSWGVTHMSGMWVLAEWAWHVGLLYYYFNKWAW